MRPLLLLILLVSAIDTCHASVDDTLPQGVTSRFLVFPFFLRSPETSWGFGGASVFFFKARKNEDKLRTSDINLVALYTLKKQTVIVLGSTVYFPGEKEILRFQSSFSDYPDKFWGLGNQTLDIDKEDYKLHQIFFNPQFIINLYRKLFIGASYEFQNVSDFTYHEGGAFDAENIVGRHGGFSSGFGVLLTWDTRNNSYSPSHGFFSELNVTRFSDELKSDFNFSSYSLDIRKFLPLGRNRVLGMQSIVRITEGETPVRYLSVLGGSEIMRGFYKGRFAGLDMMAIQAEIRQYLFWRLGVVGFASAGQVGNALRNFEGTNFHYSYGGGIRLMVNEKEKLNLRVDFGFGKKSHGVYVILKEAF